MDRAHKESVTPTLGMCYFKLSDTLVLLNIVQCQAEGLQRSLSWGRVGIPGSRQAVGTTRGSGSHKPHIAGGGMREETQRQ